MLLSDNRNDQSAGGQSAGSARTLRAVRVQDDERSAPAELWLDKPQVAIDGCGAFVVLVGLAMGAALAIARRRRRR